MIAQPLNIDKFINNYNSCKYNMNYPKLNLNDLHLLHLINRHRSITAAAQAVNLTQSTLSRRLQTIELELGVQLFQRTTRKLNITAAGKQLLTLSLIHI